MTPDWMRQRFWDRPVMTIDASSNSGAGNSCGVRPLDKGFSLAFMIDQGVVATVSGLLDPGSPLAVIRRVVAIIVFAVDGMFVAGSLAHVGQEVLEPLVTNPSLADRDAACSVINELRRTRIRAATFHRNPCAELGGQRSPVRRSGDRDSISCSASATRATAASQHIGADDLQAAAIATALPVQHVRVRTGSRAKHDKLSESLANKVYSVVSHDPAMSEAREILATTTAAFTGLQASGPHRLFFTAFAPTQPRDVAAMFVREGKDRPMTKRLTNQRFDFSHNPYCTLRVYAESML